MAFLVEIIPNPFVLPRLKSQAARSRDAANMKLTISPLQWLAGVMLCMSLVNAHTVIVYPGYRGNNLHTTGTVENDHGLGASYNSDNKSIDYPYGMQWIYPCMLS